MINKVLVLGLGKVGSLVGIMLSHQFEVTGVDKQRPHYDTPLPFKVITGQVDDPAFLSEHIKQYDAVVSALPYFLNAAVARVAAQHNKHYFDLTEDVETTKGIRKLSETAKSVMAPQCGLAPGYIGVVGADLAKNFDELRSIEMRVGALPKFPSGQLGYSFNWSAAGVVNEYINGAEAIHNGQRSLVTSLQGKEVIQIDGDEYEAFYTSGGLGTMCETYEGKVDRLDYKTIRYPGHCDLMNFLIHELHLKSDKKHLEEILENAKPAVDEDVVIVYAAAEGRKEGKLFRKEFCKKYEPIEIDGVSWRAISWTTAAGIASVVELVSTKKIASTGFIKQEKIDLNDFLNTRSGRYFKQ